MVVLGQKVGRTTGQKDDRAREEDNVQILPQEDDVQILSLKEDNMQAVSKTSNLPTFKRNYFWCPVPDCTSDPVQNMTQHLQKKHTK